jgi:hypothetical protein
MKTVWIYVDTRKQVGDRDHLKVFANSALADEWFVVNEPEGVVFEYEVIGVVVDEAGQDVQRHRWGRGRPPHEVPGARARVRYMRDLAQVVEHIHDSEIEFWKASPAGPRRAVH